MENAYQIEVPDFFNGTSLNFLSVRRHAFSAAPRFLLISVAMKTLVYCPEFKESYMIKSIVTLVVVVLALNVNATVYKCTGNNGRVQFSDTPCRVGVGSDSEIMTDRLPVTQQQRLEALQRTEQMKVEAAALAENKSVEETNQRSSSQHWGADSGKTSSAARTSLSDLEAYANCVRDIELHGASQNIKAELIAACRTAVIAQGNKDSIAEVAGECVRSVERTGASEAEKSKQLAICHGGDVRPQFIPVPAQTGSSPRN